MEETQRYDVPLLVTRGYPSLSYVHEAAEAIVAQDKPAILYYFGDHDPSGQDISRHIQERLAEFCQDTPISFVRAAVTPEQVQEWNLPTRPTKKTDTRAKSFKGESVEVDAIPPPELRHLCRTCIERHIDRDQVEVIEAAEESERDLLRQWAREVR